MNTQKYKVKLQKFYASHGHLAGAFLGGIVLGTMIWNGVVLQGHFLQKVSVEERTVEVKTVVRKKPVISSERARMLERRAERLAKLEQSPVIKKTNVVQAVNTRPTLTVEVLPIVDEQTHSAAPEILQEQSSSSIVPSQAEVILQIPSSTSSTSYTSQTPSKTDDFPAFDRAIHPVAEIPNWGNMFTPAEWNRTYRQMTDADFIRVPSYDVSRLTIPLDTLAKSREDKDSIEKITEKLYYSTRHFGAYDLDSGEFEAVHPGIDLKLPEGTPIGSVAGGRVHDVRSSAEGLGKHVIIEHRAPDGKTYYSIYGHLGSASVQKGDTVKAGQMIGIVGMTGNTSGPHLHLQIDRGEPNEAYHSVYWPESMPSRSEADRYTINPITFLRQY